MNNYAILTWKLDSDTTLILHREMVSDILSGDDNLGEYAEEFQKTKLVTIWTFGLLVHQG